jgi:hypothetical protein
LILVIGFEEFEEFEEFDIFDFGLDEFNCEMIVSFQHFQQFKSSKDSGKCDFASSLMAK